MSQADTASAEKLGAFLAASRLLTGEDRLDRDLAGAYLASLSEASSETLAKLLAAAARASAASDPAEAMKTELAADPEAAAGAKSMIYLWFSGALRFPDGPRFVSEQAYFGGLIWRCVGAHPPALSGGYLGHWRYLPDD